MSDILLWMHPLMQVCAAVLGVWAMWQGLKRVAMLLGKKTLFPWKQHVKLGTLALVLWILGALGFDAGFVRQHPHYRTARRTGVADHRAGHPWADHRVHHEPLQEEAEDPAPHPRDHQCPSDHSCRRGMLYRRTGVERFFVRREAGERGKDGPFPVPSLFWQAGASGEEPDNRAALKSKDFRAARL